MFAVAMAVTTDLVGDGGPPQGLLLALPLVERPSPAGLGGGLEVRAIVRADGRRSSKRVRLLRYPGLEPVAETWSDATTGEYRFGDLVAGQYLCIGDDPSGVYAHTIVGPVPAVPPQVSP